MAWSPIDFQAWQHGHSQEQPAGPQFSDLAEMQEIIKMPMDLVAKAFNSTTSEDSSTWYITSDFVCNIAWQWDDLCATVVNWCWTKRVKLLSHPSHLSWNAFQRSTLGIQADHCRILLLCQDPDQVVLQTWDFAGQEMYYSMAHVFITAPGIYVLVVDLSAWLEAVTMPASMCSYGLPVELSDSWPWTSKQRFAKSIARTVWIISFKLKLYIPWICMSPFCILLRTL